MFLGDAHEGICLGSCMDLTPTVDSQAGPGHTPKKQRIGPRLTYV